MHHEKHHKQEEQASSRKSVKTFSWRAPEYLYKKKTLLWYTNVSVFFFLVFIAFFFAHYYFAVVLVSALFWFAISRADDHPKTIDYKIDIHGLTVGDHTISFGEIHSFSLDNSNSSPVFIFDLNGPLAMPVTVLAHKENLEDIIELLVEHVPMNNSISFINWITHKLHY